MSAYFFATGEERRRGYKDECYKAINALLGRQHPDEMLNDLALDISRCFEASRDPLTDNAMYRTTIDRVKDRLHVSDSEALEIWRSLIESSKETFEEHTAVVLTGCSAFESLLNALVIHLGVWSGLSSRQARATVENMRRPQDVFIQFKKWAGCDFNDAANKIGYAGFKDQWLSEVREARNRFMHGRDDAIARSTAVLTFELLPQLVQFFVALQNHFAPMSV